MTNSLSGVIPAIVSPCDDDDRFLEAPFVEQIHRVYREGVQGVYVCGGTGDALRMPDDERKLAVELAVEASGSHNGTVIAHVGNQSTRQAVALAEHAAEAGVHAVSSMPPFSTTHRQVHDFYATISRAVDLPLLVYHIPQITGIDTSVEQMLGLLEIPNVVGIKCSGNDLMSMKRIAMARPETVLINGVDEKFTLGLLYGACGGIGMWYSIFPRLFLDIFAAVSDRNIDRALELQTPLVDLWQVALADIRAAFEIVLQIKGFGYRAFRRPHPVVGAETRVMLQRELPSRIAAIDRAK